MKIETKLDLGNVIYFINERKIHNSIVQGIKIEFMPKKGETICSAEIIYLCNEKQGESVNFKVEEKNAFKTKQDLIDSL